MSDMLFKLRKVHKLSKLYIMCLGFLPEWSRMLSLPRQLPPMLQSYNMPHLLCQLLSLPRLSQLHKLSLPMLHLLHHCLPVMRPRILPFRNELLHKMPCQLSELSVIFRLRHLLKRLLL